MLALPAVQAAHPIGSSPSDRDTVQSSVRQWRDAHDDRIDRRSLLLTGTLGMAALAVPGFAQIAAC